MIWLQSWKSNHFMVAYEHSDGSYWTTSKLWMKAKSRWFGAQYPSVTVGHYACFSSVFVAMYRLENRFFIRAGETCVPLANNIGISVSGKADARRLVVSDGTKQLASICYKINSFMIIEDDPTPFVEEEDFDFGLFISNVSKNESRKRILLGLDCD